MNNKGFISIGLIVVIAFGALAVSAVSYVAVKSIEANKEIATKETEEIDESLFKQEEADVTEEVVKEPRPKEQAVVDAIQIQTVAPKVSSLEDRNEAYALFTEVISDAMHDVEEIRTIAKSMMGYPSTFQSEIFVALEKFDELIADTETFIKEVYGYAENINANKYVDLEYWHNTGISKLVLKQKTFLERRVAIMKEFNDSVEYAGQSSNNYVYDDICNEIENSIRESISISGGLATESQIQAILNQKGCY
ncbi:MAG: hypothetical protein COU09_00135 [Candidatus Harrisonbacteria bacterium CG10_big_fil_rev_8_21_14_0_10_44_23]|uniref:Uncharacterized protein n=1 Tax=Candidatus Harrisonbacteria bacterium CG10_big_fil_rev_8_21_14_0_10_44_23 TaxID=1974585 RepID=A0A2H0USQ4_9BACT|nr:MAG: hypothetical protein COU09_00135 [Candidatus Harrisonbacteria bacterium CG10_big_fil_rev_8_21_14_0_10_44_23]